MKKYKSLLYVVVGVIIVSFLLNMGDDRAAVQTQQQSQVQTATQPFNVPLSQTPQSQIQSNALVQPSNTPAYQDFQKNSGLSNDNYYTNVSGNKVHAPAYSGSVPVGATAQCRDGTYSFSQHRQGICSGHGGVAQWL